MRKIKLLSALLLMLSMTLYIGCNKVLIPLVTTSQPENVTTTGCTAGGEVTDDGTGEIIERGVCWSTEANPEITSSHMASGTGMGAFTCEIKNLREGTTYYVRAYAINSAGTGYGEAISFTTLTSGGEDDEDLPEVTTAEVSEVTQTTAQGGGNVTEDHGAEVTERGLCWGTTPDPTVEGSHVAASEAGTGTFTCGITGLTAGTKYYVRAYATNKNGTGYGEAKSFTTETAGGDTPALAPEVSTTEVSNITQTSAQGGGIVTADNGAAVVERGVCWSTSNNPTIEGSHSAATTAGTGAFTCNITELAPGTRYYVRAYATNENGTGYGEVKSFTTQTGGDDDPTTAPTVVTGDVENIGQTTAKANGNVTKDGGGTILERGICYGTSHNPDITGSHATASTNGTGQYNCQLSGLTPGTTYYVRAYAKNKEGLSYGREVRFRTLESASMPTVTTTNVSNVTQTTAKGGGNVTSDGGATVTERGLCWSTSANPTVSGSHVAATTAGTGVFVCNISGLTPNTTYHVRAYAKNSVGTSYGQEVTLTTLPSESIPTVTTASITNITETSASGGGNVTSDGGATVTERGLCWSTSANPTVSGSHATASSGGTGSFVCNMTGLNSNTTYHVRAYAKNSQGIAYGEDITFTTLTPAGMPTVTTTNVSNITETSGKGGGNVTSDGGSAVTERGLCWSNSANPTVNDSHVAASSAGTGAFLCNMTGLNPSTTYHVRAYAKNSVGTSYGQDVTFTTLTPATAPTVTTANVSDITETSGVGGGSVTSDGGDEVTERGLCWGTSANPTVSGSHLAASTAGTGAFLCTMTGLNPNTTYHVRAYAKNNVGTSYGQDITFTTLNNATAPTVTTANISNITVNSASGGGNVTSDGGATVTERGLCWSYDPNPTIEINETVQAASGGTGAFICSMEDLLPNTTYYVKAYAVNSQGTSYGQQVTFTTLNDATVPTVTTANVSDITETSAKCGGNVTNDGGEVVTARGICWSYDPDPNIEDNEIVQAASGGTGSFICLLEDLLPNTTYYVRAYATNEIGTSYGSTKTFTTLEEVPPFPVGAINGLFSVSGRDQVYFSQGNLQYRASTNTWQFAAEQKDYIGENNINASSTYNGWIDMFGWGTSNWDPGNQFYHPWDTLNYFEAPTGWWYDCDSLYGPFGEYDLTGQYYNSDWGHNPISNGGNEANLWRTLSATEWTYLINDRVTPSGIRYAKATVDGKNGLILLPDDWQASYYPLSETNSGGTSYSANTITASNWATMEEHGAVFLPAAGERTGGYFYNDGWEGLYWSSTHYESTSRWAYFTIIGEQNVNSGDVINRSYGLSVRLVQDAR